MLTSAQDARRTSVQAPAGHRRATPGARRPLRTPAGHPFRRSPGVRVSAPTARTDVVCVPAHGANTDIWRGTRHIDARSRVPPGFGVWRWCCHLLWTHSLGVSVRVVLNASTPCFCGTCCGRPRAHPVAVSDASLFLEGTAERTVPMSAPNRRTWTRYAPGIFNFSHLASAGVRLCLPCAPSHASASPCQQNAGKRRMGWVKRCLAMGMPSTKHEDTLRTRRSRAVYVPLL